MELGDFKAAKEQFTLCHEILLNLAKGEAGVTEHIHHLRLGRSFRNLGNAAERVAGAQAAYELYHESLKARQKALPLATDPMLVKQEIAEIYGHLGRMALELGQPREALDNLTKSIEYRNEWLDKSPGNEQALRENAGAQSLMGHAYFALGDPAKALGQFKAAFPVLDQLAKKNNAQIIDPVNAALCLNDIGIAHLMSGDPAAAKDKCEDAFERLRKLHTTDPKHPVFPITFRKLGKVHYCLGAVYQELNDPVKARSNFGQSAKAREYLARSDPASKLDHMLTVARIGDVEKAALLAEQIKKEAPTKTDALYMVACTYSLCAADRERHRIASLVCVHRFLGPYAPSAAARDRTKDGDIQPSTAQEFRSLAIKALQDAVDQGYRAPGMLKIDPDLAGVRNEADFQKLINELEEQDKLAQSKPM
jgi:tetratricopeptide (TPR) repeat protein